MQKYIVALDQGTTSSRAILFDESGAIAAKAQYDFPQHFPQPGWVEHNPMDILNSQISALKDAVAAAGITPGQIAAIGITNQRETTLVWDKETGEPVYNAIVWQCRRTADICDTLIAKGQSERVKRITGLPIDAYFSATKIKWILDNIEGAREKAKAGRLLCGTVDSWLIWNLTGRRLHITDVTNASRYMLFDIHRLCFDSSLCELLDIPMQMLPQVVDSSGVYGEVDCVGLSEFAGIPICSAIGDQQAALFGQACFAPGDVKNTYGTGCFTLMNIGGTPKLTDKLITTVGWKIGDQTVYACEGSVFNAGSSIKWLRDSLGLITNAHECDILAESVPDNGGVYFVSAFSGLGAPHWDMHARGTLVGLTRGSGRAHICRAVLEGIAFQVHDLVKTMELDCDCAIHTLRVDGGAAVSDILLQFQSDILQIAVDRPECVETTAQGAAYLAGLGCGLWRMEQIAAMRKSQEIFAPQMSDAQRQQLLSHWQQAVSSCRAYK
ncbi:MAG: glycerol kinase GlpK [Clostridia bacterium]|nr:glycerol kinase GlpK [Clostridia bacterium]